MITDIRERAFIFSPDGNTILFNKEDYEGVQKILFSEEERKLCEGNVLTHSHPNTEFAFRTFTNFDINTFFSCKLREIRLVRGPIVLSLIHKGSCNHYPILPELNKFMEKKGVSESSMDEFLRSFPCLSLTSQSIEKK